MYWSQDDLQLAKEFSQLVPLIFEREAIVIDCVKAMSAFIWAMEASQDGLWDTQIGTDIVYVSPSYFRMVGHHLPVVNIRITSRTLYSPRRSAHGKRKIFSFIESKIDKDSIEFTMRHRDGSDVWILSRMCKAESDPNDNVKRVIGKSLIACANKERPTISSC